MPGHLLRALAAPACTAVPCNADTAALPQGSRAAGAEERDAKGRQAARGRGSDAWKVQVSLERAGVAAVYNRLTQLEPSALVDLLPELEKVRRWSFLSQAPSPDTRSGHCGGHAAISEVVFSGFLPPRMGIMRVGRSCSWVRAALVGTVP